MSYRRNGLRALGVSLMAALGLMAFTAAGAQAAFLYLEGGVTKTLAVESEPVVSAHNTGTLLVPGLNIEIQCKKVESDPTAKVKLLANSVVAHGHLLFTECESFEIENKVTKVKLTLLGSCKPSSPGTASGTVLAGGLAELVLHEATGRTYVLFKPLSPKKEGEKVPFTIVVLPETCALAETSEVTGSLVAECGELVTGAFGGDKNCKTHRVEQLLQQAPQALFPTDQLKFGEQNASLDGIAAVKFGAPCANCSWGGDAV